VGPEALSGRRPEQARGNPAIRSGLAHQAPLALAGLDVDGIAGPQDIDDAIIRAGPGADIGGLCGVCRRRTRLTGADRQQNRGNDAAHDGPKSHDAPSDVALTEAALKSSPVEEGGRTQGAVALPNARLH